MEEFRNQVYQTQPSQKHNKVDLIEGESDTQFKLPNNEIREEII